MIDSSGLSGKDYVGLIFHAYWTEGLDISSDDILSNIVKSVGWNSDDFLSFIKLESTKTKLKLNTDELIERGGFGSPTIFVDQNNMFFGNDRLQLIEELLEI